MGKLKEHIYLFLYVLAAATYYLRDCQRKSISHRSRSNALPYKTFKKFVNTRILLCTHLKQKNKYNFSSFHTCPLQILQYKYKYNKCIRSNTAAIIIVITIIIL